MAMLISYLLLPKYEAYEPFEAKAVLSGQIAYLPIFRRKRMAWKYIFMYHNINFKQLNKCRS